MINPIWEREILIAQVGLDLIEMELEMEWTNAILQSQPGRQPANASAEIRNNDSGTAKDERNPQPDSGADY